MADNSCPYHTDHNSRIKKLEQNCDELDNRVTILDKEFAVSRAEMIGILKNLEKLPEAMTQMTNTLVTLQVEIKDSNSRTNNRMDGVDTRIEGMEGKLQSLDSEVVKINEDDTISIRHSFKNWLLKNWKYIGLALLLVGLYLSEIIKKMVVQ